MDTCLKGDIAEQAAVLQALKHGQGVLRPLGNRLPHDLVFDVEGTFTKIQIKSHGLINHQVTMWWIIAALRPTAGK